MTTDVTVDSTGAVHMDMPCLAVAWTGPRTLELDGGKAEESGTDARCGTAEGTAVYCTR